MTFGVPIEMRMLAATPQAPMNEAMFSFFVLQLKEITPIEIGELRDALLNYCQAKDRMKADLLPESPSVNYWPAKDRLRVALRPFYEKQLFSKHPIEMGDSELQKTADALLQILPSPTAKTIMKEATCQTCLALQERISVLEDLLISAHAIALREGEETHWARFSERLKAEGIGSVTAKVFKILPSDREEGGTHDPNVPV